MCPVAKLSHTQKDESVSNDSIVFSCTLAARVEKANVVNPINECIEPRQFIFQKYFSDSLRKYINSFMMPEILRIMDLQENTVSRSRIVADMIARLDLGITVGIVLGNRNRTNTIDEMKLQKPSCHRLPSTLIVWFLVVPESIGLSVCRTAVLISATKKFRRGKCEWSWLRK
jgi:hypothetical protein